MEVMCHFSVDNLVSVITRKRNIICMRTLLDGTTHEQPIIRRQLIAGHVLGFRPMKTKKNMHRMINKFVLRTVSACLYNGVLNQLESTEFGKVLHRHLDLQCFRELTACCVVA